MNYFENVADAHHNKNAKVKMGKQTNKKTYDVIIISLILLLNIVIVCNIIEVYEVYSITQLVLLIFLYIVVDVIMIGLYIGLREDIR